MLKHIKKYIMTLLLIFSASLNAAIESPALQLTAQEKAFLQAHPVISVHSEKAWIPYNFSLEGKPQGYVNDYIRLLAERVGVKLKFISGKSWKEYLHMLKYKEIDLISNMRITEARKEFALFSDQPIVSVTMGVLTTKENRDYSNLKNLKRKRLAVTEDFVYLKQLKVYYPDIELLYAKTAQELIDLVSKGEAEAAISTHERFNYLLKRRKLSNLISTPLLKERPLKASTQYLGIRNDWPLLKSALDKAAKSIDKKTRLALEEKWLMPMKESKGTHPVSRQSSGFMETQSTSSMLWIILSAISALAAGILFIRYRVLAKKLTSLTASNHHLTHEYERLQNSATTKDAYLANVSHEIRTPISAVLGMSTLALQTDLDHKQYGYISRIHSSSELLLGLVNQILDFSKIEAGEMTLEEVEFDLNAIFENLSNIVCMHANEKKIDIIFDVNHDVPIKLIGDPLRVNQILINLVMNALKFTKEGEVSILAKELPSQGPGATLEFVVQDTGIGIKKENLGKLFHSFAQADDSTSRLHGGTGLGLSISKKLINQMGGDIYVESTYGKGTRFIFTITVGLPEKPDKRKYRLPFKESMNKNILIVDSSTASLNALHKKLAYFHFTIMDTTSWHEAQEYLKEGKNRYDIIFINAKVFVNDDIDAIAKELAQQASKIIFIAHDISGFSGEQLEKIDSPAFLERPYSQQRLFELLVQIEKCESQKKTDFILPKSMLNVIRGSKIILAEDNKINQSIIVGLLEDTGIEITIANNGREVLTLLNNSNDYDLVLMDVNMPLMGGYEATRALRRQKQFDRLPIIALTASMLEDDIRQSEEAGMNAHIGKPIRVQEFYAALLEFIPPQHEPSTETSTPKVKKPLELHDLQTINTKEALERTGGSSELLLEMLNDFVKQFTPAGKTIKTLIETHQFTEAEEIIHDILGTAGNISASRLHEATLSLESILKSGEARQINMRVTAFTEALDTLVEEIEGLS